MYSVRLWPMWADDPACAINRAAAAWFTCFALGAACITSSVAALAVRHGSGRSTFFYVLLILLPVGVGLVSLWIRTEELRARMRRPRVPWAIAGMGAFVGFAVAALSLDMINMSPLWTIWRNFFFTVIAIALSSYVNVCNELVKEMEPNAEGEAPREIAGKARIGTTSAQIHSRTIVARRVVRTSQVLLNASFYVWAIVVRTIAQLVRLRRERQSYVCTYEDCGLVIDDPWLQCRCSGAAAGAIRAEFRNYPRREHPLFVQCVQCKSVYPTWYPTMKLLRPEIGARFGSVRCRMGCGVGVIGKNRRWRVLIIPFDAKRLAHTLRALGCQLGDKRRATMSARTQRLASKWADLTVITPDAPGREWAGRYDVIVVVTSSRVNAPMEVDVAEERVQLPSSAGGWGLARLYEPIRGLWRLITPVRDEQDVAPYPLRRIPKKVAIAEVDVAELRGFDVVAPGDTGKLVSLVHGGAHP